MDWEVREFSIPVAETEGGGAVPLPSGWEPMFAERRADFLVLLLRRQAVVGP
jgi:hypothetical protein